MGLSRRNRRLYAGDVARVIRESLRGVSRGSVALATVTAPGGTFGTVEAAAWNGEAARNWRRLRDRIKREMMRRYGLRPPVLLVRVAQRQSRGLDHLHLCFWLLTPDHRRRITLWVQLYREYREAYGFGYVDDPFHVRRLKNGRMSDMVFRDPATAGFYLGNYLGSGQLERYIAAEDTSWSPVWISPALQHRTGWSLRRCHQLRQAWHLRNGTWSSVTWCGALRLPAWYLDTDQLEWIKRVTGWDGEVGARGIPARGPSPRPPAKLVTA
jgi:hypothetical protein